MFTFHTNHLMYINAVEVVSVNSIKLNIFAIRSLRKRKEKVQYEVIFPDDALPSA